MRATEPPPVGPYKVLPCFLSGFQMWVSGQMPVKQSMFSPQLKEKHKQSGGSVGALEELENAFSLAEESCPGISDKLMVHLVERVQR